MAGKPAKNKKSQNNRNSNGSSNNGGGGGGGGTGNEKKKARKKSTVSKGGSRGGKGAKFQFDMFNEAAMENAYYLCHNVQDLLKTRGFPWPELQKKKKKGRR